MPTASKSEVNVVVKDGSEIDSRIDWGTKSAAVAPANGSNISNSEHSSIGNAASAGGEGDMSRKLPSGPNLALTPWTIWGGLRENENLEFQFRVWYVIPPNYTFEQVCKRVPFARPPEVLCFVLHKYLS